MLQTFSKHGQNMLPDRRLCALHAPPKKKLGGGGGGRFFIFFLLVLF